MLTDTLGIGSDIVALPVLEKQTLCISYRGGITAQI